MVEPHEITNALQILLRSSTRKEETEDIKGVFRQLAIDRGLTCHTSGEAGRKELLFDVIWTHNENIWGHFSDIPLVCEIELTPTLPALTQDFRKLLLANAPLRVFVMCLGNPGHGRTRLRFERVIYEFNKMVGGCRRVMDDDRFLVIDFGRESQSAIITKSEDWQASVAEEFWHDERWWADPQDGNEWWALPRFEA